MKLHDLKRFAAGFAVLGVVGLFGWALCTWKWFCFAVYWGLVAFAVLAAAWGIGGVFFRGDQS